MALSSLRFSNGRTAIDFAGAATGAGTGDASGFAAGTAALLAADATTTFVGGLIGKNRSTIANALRLLKLPEGVIDLIESKQLSEGHGRALLGAGDTATMLRLVLRPEDLVRPPYDVEVAGADAFVDLVQPRAT